MKNPDISIIIAARDAEKYIQTCLDSLLQEKPSNYEIIIVDDASEDDTLKILKKYQKQSNIVLHSFPTQKGAAAARNFGATESRGAYLFFLDSDTKIPTGWSKAIPQLYKKNPNAIMICKLLRFHSNRFDSAGEFLTPFYLLIDRAKADFDTGQFEKELPVFSGKSAAMLIQKNRFELLGGFDEKMEWLVEDTDLCFRNWLAGFTVVYQPAITVFHNDPTYEKSKGYYRKLQPRYRGCRNTIRMVLKNADGKKLWYAVPVQLSIWLFLSIIMLVRLDFASAGELLHGILWNTLNMKDTWKARQTVQQSRVVSDQKILSTVGESEPITHYLDKAIRYVTG